MSDFQIELKKSYEQNGLKYITDLYRLYQFALNATNTDKPLSGKQHKGLMAAINIIEEYYPEATILTSKIKTD